MIEIHFTDKKSLFFIDAGKRFKTTQWLFFHFFSKSKKNFISKLTVQGDQVM